MEKSRMQIKIVRSFEPDIPNHDDVILHYESQAGVGSRQSVVDISGGAVEYWVLPTKSGGAR
jgi:hypothetical protein